MAEEPKFQIEQMLRRIKYDPKDQDALYELAKAYGQLGQTMKARDTFLKIVKLNPSFPGGYYNLGCFARDAGDNNLAMNSFMKAIEVDPEDFDAHLNLGGAFVGVNEFEKAREVFEGLIALDTNSYQGYSAIWYLYFAHLNQPESAIAYFQNAVGAKPKDPSTHYFLALSYYEMSELKKSLISLRKFFELPFNNEGYSESQMQEIRDLLKVLEENEPKM